jgi:transposase
VLAAASRDSATWRAAKWSARASDLHALMDGHTHAFGRFGGCAQRCTYDSQKPVVLR